MTTDAPAVIKEESYDAHQMALMEEVCIRVDEHDKSLGSITKKQGMCHRFRYFETRQILILLY